MIAAVKSASETTTLDITKRVNFDIDDGVVFGGQFISIKKQLLPEIITNQPILDMQPMRNSN